MTRVLRPSDAVRVLTLALSVTLYPAAVWAQATPDDDAPMPRTAWGAPDIGGVWSSATVTPLQRPVGQADKEFLELGAPMIDHLLG